MEWNVLIGAVCTVLGAVIGYMTFYQRKEQEDMEDGRRIGSVLTELGHIKADTADIKSELRQMQKENKEFAGQLASIESSVKSAHKRIDRLEQELIHATAN